MRKKSIFEELLRKYQNIAKQKQSNPLELEGNYWRNPSSLRTKKDPLMVILLVFVIYSIDAVP